jgi:hypothetical protein
MHLLELTKTAWNARLSATELTELGGQIPKERVASFLDMTRRILFLYGREGDDDGPLSEIEVLTKLLSIA